VSLPIRGVSCRQQIVVPCFFLIQLASQCLLLEELRPFTLGLINERFLISVILFFFQQNTNAIGSFLSFLFTLGIS
jgi:hypothetical protein